MNQRVKNYGVSRNQPLVLLWAESTLFIGWSFLDISYDIPRKMTLHWHFLSCMIFLYSHTLLIECPYVAAPGDSPHEVAVASYSVIHLPLDIIVYLYRQLSHFWWHFPLLMVSWVSLSFIFTLFWHSWLQNVGVIHACGERSDRWGLAGSELFALDLPNSMFYAITARALCSSFYVGTYLVLS